MVEKYGEALSAFEKKIEKMTYKEATDLLCDIWNSYCDSIGKIDKKWYNLSVSSDNEEFESLGGYKFLWKNEVPYSDDKILFFEKKSEYAKFLSLDDEFDVIKDNFKDIIREMFNCPHDYPYQLWESAGYVFVSGLFPNTCYFKN